MITSGRLKEHLQRSPFKPFRIFLSDGSNHTVPHPEFAWVFGGRVFLGVAGKNGSENGLVKEISIPHITRIEELGHHKSKSRK